MKPRTATLLTITTACFLSCLLLTPVTALAQKKKKKKAGADAPPAAQTQVTPPAATPAPASVPTAAEPQTVSSEAAVGEQDPAREGWRINVEPYATFGSGHPGKLATDFDKPDGVSFAPNGLLFATDAHNRRIQIWDVKTKAYVAEFGHGIFGGEIVDVAVAPNGMVLVTDQVLNLAYAFVQPAPGATDEKGKPLGPYAYQFKGTRFGDHHFDKLGGIAIDSRNRVYTVDAHLNEVVRFTLDGKVDPTWQFTKTRPDGDTYLHGCEGIAIDEAANKLFIASEKDNIIQVFDWETGVYQGKLIGARSDANGKPTGKSIFSGSVEGLALAGKMLLAIDESVGHIQVFDTRVAALYNTDLAGFAASRRTRAGGYKGFFGHSPQVNFEDKTNKALQQQVKDGSIIPGQANPPGYLCSPDSISAHTDATGETYIAIADQCNYRLAVYRWSDINQALGRALGANASAMSATPAAPETPTAVAAPAEKGGKKKGKKKA